MLQLTPTTSVDSFKTASESDTPNMQDAYPAVYRIESIKTGLCADLSGQNFRSVLGFKTHDGDNQRWEITALGAGYAIRNVYSGAYLSVDLRNDKKEIVGTMFPTSWDIRRAGAQNASLYRIRWPDSEYVFTLDGGEMECIRLTKQQSQGSPAQMWRLQECEPRHLETGTEPSTVVRDLGKGNTLLDVNELDLHEGQFVVSTTTTTRIRRILGL